MNKWNHIILIFVILLLISIWLNIYFLNKWYNHQENQWIINNNIFSWNISVVPNNLKEIIWENNLENINIFQKTYDEFNNIKNFEDFKKWREIYSQKFFLVSLVKLRDYNSWQKYYNFLYDYYIDVEWWDFGKDFGNDANFQKHTDPKENFELYMKEFYEKIVSWEQIIATKDNINNDLNLSFASNDFSDLESLCEYREKNLDASMEAKSCMDDNYFYRVTKENGYCEKISDPYKIRLCYDFLNYQSK